MARAVGDGFDCFLFGLCPARLWRLLTLKLAAAKGEQMPANRASSRFFECFCGHAGKYGCVDARNAASDKKL